MRLEPPAWWYETDATWTARLLQPLAGIYGLIVKRRFQAVASQKSNIPVICIGNFTAGGAGKTPLAIFIANQLGSLGHAAAFLTRGYGGTTVGPHYVDPTIDTAREVGDEALLLARHAPVVVARNRPDGANAIESTGVDAIVMDDGLQNPSLAKDLTIAVIDAEVALGNQRVIPSGPLRAPLDFQLGLVDAIVINHSDGEAPATGTSAQRFKFDQPTFEAQIVPTADARKDLAGTPVVAFAGIGRPEKFFSTLRAAGASLKATCSFPDHHRFSDADATRLLELGESNAARLMTTEKDWVRIDAHDGPLATLRQRVTPLPIELRLNQNDEERMINLLQRIVTKSNAITI